MRTKRCSSCREVLPIKGSPRLPGGGHCDQCDAPYCQALRHAALVAVHMDMFRTFWPLLWWSFIPLAVWALWKLRTVQGRSLEMFRKLPTKLTDRVERLGYLHGLRAELVRANCAITPGIERYLSESWEYEDLGPGNQRAIDAADEALRERVAAVPDWQE